MDVDTTTNQSLTGEDIVQVEDAGEHIVQMEEAGEEIVQVKDAGEHIVQGEDAGEEIVQVEDAGEQTVQMEDTGEEIVQVEDAGEEIMQGEDVGEQIVQGEDAGDNSLRRLPCVKLISTAGFVCSVYLIGTTHRTQESCNSVRSAIKNIKPKAVFLELCEPRFRQLLEEPMPVTTWKHMVWCTITGKILIMIFVWFISKMVADIDARESEFKVAYEEAKNLQSVVFGGDIHIGLTYERIWRGTSLKEKIIIARNYRNVYAGDEKEMKKLYDACPCLYKILVEDRDKYMTFHLRNLSNKYSSILAVVGRDHVEGIHKNLSENIEVNGDELIEEISRFNKSSAVKIVVSAGIVGILIGCYFWRKN